jgi:hypothetical protein
MVVDGEKLFVVLADCARRERCVVNLDMCLYVVFESFLASALPEHIFLPTLKLY